MQKNINNISTLKLNKMKDFDWKDWFSVLFPTILITTIWFLLGVFHPTTLADIRKFNDKPISSMNVGDLSIILLLIWALWRNYKPKN